MHVYVDGTKKRGKRVARAFARGAGAYLTFDDSLRPDRAAFWGITRGKAKMIDQCIGDGREWFYLDHCYLGRRFGAYRVTRNAFQHTGVGTGDPARLDSLNVTIKEWRPGGDFILVCPPGELMSELRGWKPPRLWIERVTKTLRQHTDRPIRIRHKPNNVRAANFQSALVGCHAVVTHISNTAIDAILAGVPAFVTGECAALPLAETDLTRIEIPRYPSGRREWAACLASNQWTMDEMDRGKCAADLGIK